MATQSGQPVYRATTTAPVNIAVIKYVNCAPLAFNHMHDANVGFNLGIGANVMLR